MVTPPENSLTKYPTRNVPAGAYGGWQRVGAARGVWGVVCCLCGRGGGGAATGTAGAARAARRGTLGQGKKCIRVKRLVPHKTIIRKQLKLLHKHSQTGFFRLLLDEPVTINHSISDVDNRWATYSSVCSS